MEEEFHPIGRVIKPHGVRGKVKIDYYGETASRFPYRRIFIRDLTGKPTPFEVLEVIPHPPRFILKLKGIETIEEAEPLLGREVLLPRRDFPPLQEDEFYWFEIIGMAVETETGRRIGRVKGIFPTGANDVYIVQGKRREIFLPAIEPVIREIDRQKKVIRVAWMEGLWEEEDEV
ncbi:MAG: ribosome maturation factor RimM [Desulfobacterota bacterium]|nr:ribosome maturation factor RimM [Thermodesulfobacteriota bacterium]